MQTLLAPGQPVQLQTAPWACTVVSFLGSGGQGEVYEVDVMGSGYRRRHALKWYFPRSATARQRDALWELVRGGRPHARFLWPIDLARVPGEEGFGYLMPLRGSEFSGLVELMNGTVSPSFRALATTGFDLADGFLQLHAAGYCYRDISFGNVFFNPDSGHALICDNDNVGIDDGSRAEVQGTPGFMAPEVMRGEAPPSTATDLFSLAVLLFHLFMVSHPLHGRLELEEDSLDMAAMRRLYGTRPVFIFDPGDRSNPPVPGVHDNALVYWPIYPPFLRELFTRAFTRGVRDPLNGRVRETEWRAAMVRLRDAIASCGRCGAENFWDESRASMPPCWRCGQPAVPPPRLELRSGPAGGGIVLLGHGTPLYRHHVGQARYDFDEPVAEVVRHPAAPDVSGLKNLSADPWVAVAADGQTVDVAPGRSVTLAAGTRIHFGPVEGEIRS